jgi:hypothetical protein
VIRATPDGRVTAEVAQPLFVTPHAMRRWRERVRPDATEADAVREIQERLQGRMVYPPRRPLAVSDRMRTFVAVVAPPPAGQSWPSVVSVYRWRDYWWREDGRPRRRRVG